MFDAFASVFRQIAKHYDKSAAQILIKWCLQRGFVVLPKSVTSRRIVENSQVCLPSDVMSYGLSAFGFVLLVKWRCKGCFSRTEEVLNDQKLGIVLLISQFSAPDALSVLGMWKRCVPCK